MSKSRSYNVNMTLTARMVLSADDVANLIKDTNAALERLKKSAGAGCKASEKDLYKMLGIISPEVSITEENFDYTFQRLVRSGIRHIIATENEFPLESLTRRQCIVKINPRGVPKMDTSVIAKSAWPFPASH